MTYAYRTGAGKLGYRQLAPDLDHMWWSVPAIRAGKNNRSSTVTRLRFAELHDGIQAGKGVDLPLPC